MNRFAEFQFAIIRYFLFFWGGCPNTVLSLLRIEKSVFSVNSLHEKNSILSSRIGRVWEGRPGTLSIQTSQQAARNHSYRCRSIKEDETAVKQHDCGFGSIPKVCNFQQI